MPEIKNYKEFDEINNIKQRMTKNLKKTYADIEPFGLTVGDAKSVDSLVAATEDIETNAELVVSKLDKGVARPKDVLSFNDASKQIDNFYKSVRKGLSSVKSTKFKGIPRTDINKLADYLPSLQGYLARFETLFQDVQVRNAPINPNQEVQQLKDNIQAIQTELQEGEELLIDAELQVRNGTNNDVDDQIVDEFPEYLQGLRDDIALKSAQLIREEKKVPAKKITETGKEYFKQVAEIDYGMILKNFTEFITLLSDGIASFNSGRTVQGNLGGSYMIGGADYMPRRFM
jgi:hypothetical protein